MSVAFLNPPSTHPEQRFILPEIYAWQDFEALEWLLSDSSKLRITYLDGWIELMTLGEAHELIKSLLGMFIEAYLIAMEIEFIPAGSATRRGEDKGTSFEPDESYYLGEQKENPDLEIEVVLTSANLNKLEKYRRFGITEVWFWEENQLQVYYLQGEDYQQVSHSQLLPDLDLDLLVRCMQMPSRVEAMKLFTDAIQHS